MQPLTIDKLIGELIHFRELLGPDCPIACAHDDEGVIGREAGELTPGYLAPDGYEPALISDDDADDVPGTRRCLVIWPNLEDMEGSP